MRRHWTLRGRFSGRSLMMTPLRSIALTTGTSQTTDPNGRLNAQTLDLRSRAHSVAIKNGPWLDSAVAHKKRADHHPREPWLRRTCVADRFCWIAPVEARESAGMGSSLHGPMALVMADAYSETRTMRGRVLLVAGLLLLTLGAAGCSSVPAQVQFSFGTAFRDLPYCNGQKLDLYIPRTDIRPLAVAMYVHGGGMTGGDKSNLKTIFLNALASNHYAVASIDYRLAPSAHFPAQIEDVKCAVRYLRAVAPEYGLSPREVFAFGTSVGGQLAALAALTGLSHSVWDVGARLTESSRLAAAADFFGPALLTERASGFTQTGIQDVFGRNNRRELVLASPIHYVGSSSPPILLVHGVKDDKVLKSQSIQLYRNLIRSGNRAQLILVRNMGHMFVQAGSKPLRPSMRQIAQELVSFFDHVRSHTATSRVIRQT